MQSNFSFSIWLLPLKASHGNCASHSGYHYWPLLLPFPFLTPSDSSTTAGQETQWVGFFTSSTLLNQQHKYEILWWSWFFKVQLCKCCTLRSWVHQVSMLFRTFSPQLEDLDTFQCSFNSFPHGPHISGCVQNCQNYISMYRCSPIAGRRSWKSVLNLSHSYVFFHDLLPAIEEQWYIKN